jgi:hypothetical protein
MTTQTTLPLFALQVKHGTYQLDGSSRINRMTPAKARQFADIEMQYDELYQCWRNVRPTGNVRVVMVRAEQH